MGWGPQNDSDSRAAILEALECGINWIDTAPAYGLGHAEEVVGKVLKEWGAEAVVASKCGLVPNGTDGVRPKLKKESIFKEVEDSLRRLQLDALDLYQIHWPRPEGDIEEGIRALSHLKKQGKIRYIGVSNFSVEHLETASAIAEIASLQPPYSLLRREIEKNILPWCSKNNLGVICYSPMECGLLTGKFSKDWIASLPDSDWRKTTARKVYSTNFFEEPGCSQLANFVNKLSLIAGRHNKTPAQLAVAWTLANKDITAAIVGARRSGQIAETAQAAEWRLDSATLQEIEDAIDEFLG